MQLQGWGCYARIGMWLCMSAQLPDVIDANDHRFHLVETHHPRSRPGSTGTPSHKWVCEGCGWDLWTVEGDPHADHLETLSPEACIFEVLNEPEEGGKSPIAIGAASDGRAFIMSVSDRNDPDYPFDYVVDARIVVDEDQYHALKHGLWNVLDETASR